MFRAEGFRARHVPHVLGFVFFFEACVGFLGFFGGVPRV